MRSRRSAAGKESVNHTSKYSINIGERASVDNWTALKNTGDSQDWQAYTPLHKAFRLTQAAIAKAKP